MVAVGRGRRDDRTERRAAASLARTATAPRRTASVGELVAPAVGDEEATWASLARVGDGRAGDNRVGRGVAQLATHRRGDLAERHPDHRRHPSSGHPRRRCRSCRTSGEEPPRRRPGRQRGGRPRPPPGLARAPCRGPARYRLAVRRRSPTRSPRAGRRSRRPHRDRRQARPGRAGGAAARMAAGSSERGLSSVMTTTSACRAAAAPISGRFAVVAVAAATEHRDHPALRPASDRRPGRGRSRRACGRSRRSP